MLENGPSWDDARISDSRDVQVWKADYVFVKYTMDGTVSGGTSDLAVIPAHCLAKNEQNLL